MPHLKVGFRIGWTVVLSPCSCFDTITAYWLLFIKGALEGLIVMYSGNTEWVTPSKYTYQC